MCIHTVHNRMHQAGNDVILYKLILYLHDLFVIIACAFVGGIVLRRAQVSICSERCACSASTSYL